ncbi:MAG: hypothetical protein RLZZ210_1683 [Pseudomonadota bacterium]|jgi:hypothetical protein
MTFLLVLFLIGVGIFLYIRYKHIADPKIAYYKKIIGEFLMAFTSWEAFKKMLYGAELPPELVAPPVTPLAQRRVRRVRVTPAKLNQEDNGYDVLHRVDEVQTLKDYDKKDQHPRAFELALLLNSKDAKVKKSDRQNSLLQKKAKPRKLEEPSAFIKPKAAGNPLNRDK